MLKTKEWKQKRNNIFKACLLMFLSFILFGGLYQIVLQHDLNAEKERYDYIARNQAEHIITTIDCVISRSNTLKVMVKENNGETAWFDYVAEDIYESVQDETGVKLKNFAIAPNGVVSDVYPLEGNEALIGFDFLDTSLVGNIEAMEAYRNGKTIVTNPFELIQGGIGMGGRSGVILKDDNGDSLWGLVTVTIDFDNLMEVIRLDDLNGMGVDYTLSYIDSEGNAQYMYGARDLGGNTVKTPFNVRNLLWVLEVKPQKGWLSVWDIATSIIVIVSLSVLVGALTYMMLRLRDSNEQLKRLSSTDVMTGCFNRRAYEEKLKELSNHKTDENFVYVAADLNGLKQINDTLGHSAGDEIISGISDCMQKAFGEYGSLYRIGGDEFVALICTPEETLAEIKKNLNSIVDEWKGEKAEKISVSIGYASHREYPDKTIRELAKIAEEKMYKEKSEYYKTHERRQS